jgi:hypothetical protein
MIILHEEGCSPVIKIEIYSRDVKMPTYKFKDSAGKTWGVIKWPLSNECHFGDEQRDTAYTYSVLETEKIKKSGYSGRFMLSSFKKHESANIRA